MWNSFGPGDPDTIAALLRNYLTDNNLTRSGFAEHMGWSNSSVNYYAKGERTPSPRRLIKLARVLGVEVRELIREEFR
ncbi:helix-turn-helix domain-containing protein [Saccharopolyspora shandongensis]|uniref:helix-turn-helix domain-containing protein n=1 Tax=Saccharopolyspora shandongensis TaxID=418495 RepID=UPI000B878843